MSDTNKVVLANCGCGEWAGERCRWAGSPADMVVVEYMPRCNRESHTAARNSGSWPYNGSIRVACYEECAEQAVADDAEWVSVVSANPLDYAEILDSE